MALFDSVFAFSPGMAVIFFDSHLKIFPKLSYPSDGRALEAPLSKVENSSNSTHRSGIKGGEGLSGGFTIKHTKVT